MTAEKTVNATPSKSFFVNMLTRDIELKDAILDLLDNCLDGVLRGLKQRRADGEAIDENSPYKGYYAHIEFNNDFFKISDNCGGIEKKNLEEEAFRMGNPNLGKDEDLATVGLYGIGMKRAIFKMGEYCLVTTQYQKNAYQVEITPDWLKNDNDWFLSINDVEPNRAESGTDIEIKALRDEVKCEFDTEKNKAFSDDFFRLIATHYSYIIHKGFEVKVNGNSITPKEIYLRFGKNKSGENEISPYIYKGQIDNVDVDLVVGLYREVPTDSEMEEMNYGKGNRKENAGWTVICNDRVVIYNDTSFLTGWGEGNVPKYHTQFIAISGVVRFYSNNPIDLPLTTTKRGINLNSSLYAEVKNIMRDGLKHFTDFTNKWKSDSAERREIYEQTDPVEPLKAFLNVRDTDWKTSRKVVGKFYIPKLPVPKEDGDQKKIVHFLRPQSEIRLLAEYLLQNPDAAPSTVGEKCFDDYYSLAVSNSSK